MKSVDRAAIYDHYKGGKYTALFVGRNSTNSANHEPVVIYVSLTTGQVCVRDFEEFFAPVLWPDGQLHPRFVPAR